MLVAPFVGSFLGLLIVRLPIGEGVVWERSACRGCKGRLGARDLVPLLSWLWARGRCRYCGARIGWFYPGIELAALAVALWAAALTSGWVFWASCGLGWTLLALAAIDYRHLILPDALTLPLVPAGLAVAWLIDPAMLPHHMFGAVAGFVGFALVGWVYARLRGREGLGLGDAKLLAAAGAWVSWTGLPSVVLLAGVVGLAGVLAAGAAGRGGGLGAERAIAFGPCLALATWLVWLHGPIVLG
ncbi:MAG TPA: A24 family peptidase [Geminicoccaceae bacterium]|nr:A24 family peptidase [Geminicoccaceae bacterium]